MLITAMTTLAKNVGANRIVAGTKIPHPCGDPTVSPKRDREIGMLLLEKSFELLQKPVQAPEIVQAV